MFNSFFAGLEDGSTGDKSSSDPPKTGLILGCACQNRNNVEIEKNLKLISV